MRCLIAELTAEWSPGSSSVVQLLVLEPWITGCPPICFLLGLVLPAEILTMGMKGSGLLERDDVPLFLCSPCHFPRIRDSFCLYLALLVKFALHHHGWRNCVHLLDFCEACSWEEALMVSWYASRNFIWPLNGKFLRCYGFSSPTA